MDVYDFNAVLVYESNQLKQCDGKAEKKNSSKLMIGWRSPKGTCRLRLKPVNPH